MRCACLAHAHLFCKNNLSALACSPICNTMETRIHKIISVSWTLLFLVFAALQINDPDPLVWVSIYGAAAGFTLWNSFGKVPPLLLVAAILTALIFAFLLWPEEYQGLTGKMDSRPGVE
ncbi:MAG TPA: hypothetical protein ENJ82_06575, partial [Bacteroidetes bacterium]|nr:hypothetical protein [Bacteroidota bacterium]